MSFLNFLVYQLMIKLKMLIVKLLTIIRAARAGIPRNIESPI
jgi:hypothetical protein